MTGMVAVQARVAELQARIAQMSGATPVATTSTSSTAGTSATFASQLADLTGIAAADSTSAIGGAAVTGDDVIDSAKKYLGIPYKWGGTDPKTGLDCSGLVKQAFGDLGIDLPRTSTEQAKVGEPVASIKDARPGDLIFNRDPNHIGIYVGDGKMLHAPRTGDVVKIGPMWREPDAIRRVVGTDAAQSAFSAASVGAAGRPAALRGSSSFDQMFSAAEARNSLPAGLLSAVAKVESNYNPNAVSHAGAQGLMQIMPGTARGLGVDATVPSQAIDGAARLLRDHLDSFGSIDLALAAYNAGPGAVRRYDGVPPFKETTNYVRKVTSAMAGGL